MLLHRYIKINNNEFKNANKLFRKIVSVPFYPALKNKEIDKVQKLKYFMKVVIKNLTILVLLIMKDF